MKKPTLVVSTMIVDDDSGRPHPAGSLAFSIPAEKYSLMAFQVAENYASIVFLGGETRRFVTARAFRPASALEELACCDHDLHRLATILLSLPPPFNYSRR